MTLSRRRPDTCRWCGRPLPVTPGPGRPRRFCRRSCRQRDYEARRRSRELGLAEAEIVVTRGELERLRDGLSVLALAARDVRADLDELEDPADLREALAWLLEAAETLVGSG